MQYVSIVHFLSQMSGILLKTYYNFLLMHLLMTIWVPSNFQLSELPEFFSQLCLPYIVKNKAKQTPVTAIVIVTNLKQNKDFIYLVILKKEGVQGPQEGEWLWDSQVVEKFLEELLTNSTVNQHMDIYLSQKYLENAYFQGWFSSLNMLQVIRYS